MWKCFYLLALQYFLLDKLHVIHSAKTVLKIQHDSERLLRFRERWSCHVVRGALKKIAVCLVMASYLMNGDDISTDLHLLFPICLLVFFFFCFCKMLLKRKETLNCSFQILKDNTEEQISCMLENALSIPSEPNTACSAAGPALVVIATPVWNAGPQL